MPIKEEPDTAKASRLQGEISRLQARKSAPNYNRGYRGYGPMMGYGPGGGGYCMW